MPSSFEIISQYVNALQAKNSKKMTDLRSHDYIQDLVAGDAFLSGYVHGMIHQLNDSESLMYAKKLAYLTLQSNNSTNELLTKEKVEKINE